MGTPSDSYGGGKGRRGRPLDREEAQLWRKAVADVTPLPRANQQSPDATPALPVASEPRSAVFAATLPPAPAVQPSARLRVAAAAASPPPPAPPRAPPLLASGHAPGLDKRTLTRLRRGLIPPEMQVDLHCCTQEEAHRLLSCFLAASQAAGRRCVLVITGKGYGSGGAVGVLKTMVPRWLNEQPNRGRVLAFCHAASPHGGEGALYVLLRRLRAASAGS